MAIGQKEMQKIGIFGAVAGLATPLLLKYVAMPVLNVAAGVVPGISAKLADAGTISISVRESLTGINGGLSGWLVDALGLTLNVPYMTYIMGALGGALFMILGAYAADMLGMLKGNAMQKTRTTIFIGSIAAGFVLGGFAVPAINLGLVDALLAFLINAAVLAFLYVTIDDKAGLGLIPF